jgi:hypothetical protein
MEEPQDIGLKMVSETEALWTRVRDEAKELIRHSEKNLIIQNAMLKLAEEKIKEEQDKK